MKNWPVGEVPSSQLWGEVVVRLSLAVFLYASGRNVFAGTNVDVLQGEERRLLGSALVVVLVRGLVYMFVALGRILVRLLVPLE
jgi:hypothetical protein